MKGFLFVPHFVEIEKLILEKNVILNILSMMEKELVVIPVNLLLVETDNEILERLVRIVLKMLDLVSLLVGTELLILEKLVRTVLKMLDLVLLFNVKKDVMILINR